MANALAAALQKRKDKVSKSGKLYLYFPFPTTYGKSIMILISLCAQMTKRKMMIGEEQTGLIDQGRRNIRASGDKNICDDHSRLERETRVSFCHGTVSRRRMESITMVAC